MKPWQVLDSKLLIDERWLQLREDRVQLANGHQIDRFHVIHGPDWALLVANFRRSWCDLEPRAWIGISCNGCRAMAQARLKLARGERPQCLAAPAARGVAEAPCPTGAIDAEPNGR